MKALLITSAIIASLGLTSLAQADQHTVSLGYAQSKVKDFNNINGVNLKYRYEWDSPISVIGSFTYMSGKDDYSYLVVRDIFDNKSDIKYYSLSVGPAYRFNEYVSFYGLLGLSRSKVKSSTIWYNYEGGKYVDMSQVDNVEGGKVNRNTNSTNFMYGVGVQINPMANLAVDIGYEGSRLDLESQSHGINGFNIGVGYRF